MGGDAAGAARRGWARAALVALLVMVGGLVVVAAGWWAFTTRRVWKRRLNVAVAALVVASVLLDLVVVGLQGAAGVLVLAAGVLGYGATARRALGRMAAPPGSRPAHPPARPWLLVNPRSGGGKAERLGVAAAARARGMQVHELVPGDDPAALARQGGAAGADAVAGPERRIDVGVVGDRMFMNNVSLGAYAELVAEPSYRAGKLTTAHAVLPGALRGERALLQVAFQDPEGRRYQDVLVLLVANNGYELHGGAVLGARERLDAGILQISALRARTGAELAGLVARIAARRARPGAEWAQWTTATLRVDAAPAVLPAGIDGEAVTLAPPLEFRVLPLALRVLLPPALRPRAAQVSLRSWATVRRLSAVALSRGRAAPAPAAERRGGSRRSRER